MSRFAIALVFFLFALCNGSLAADPPGDQTERALNKAKEKYQKDLKKAKLQSQIDKVRAELDRAYEKAISSYSKNKTGKYDKKVGALKKELAAFRLELAGLPKRMGEMPPPFIEGNWQSEGDQLVFRGNKEKDAKIEFGDPSWTDYSFRLKAQLDEWDEIRPSRFCILCRKDLKLANSTTWEFVAFGDGGGELISTQNLSAIVPGEQSWSSPSRRWLPNAHLINLGQPYEIEMRLKGIDLTVFFAGKELAKTKHDKLVKGRVGIWGNWYGKARFSDIEVVAPDGTILWKGPPDLRAQRPPALQPN